MIFYFLYFTSGFSGLLILFIINTKYRKLSSVNIFLQIPIAIASIRFLINAFIPFNNNSLLKSIVSLFDILTTITIPCFYLYNHDLLLVNKKIKKTYKYFSFSIVFILMLFIFFIVEPKYNTLVRSIYMTLTLLYGIFFSVLNYRFLQKNIWSRKTEIKSLASHEKIINNWSIFLFICTCLILVRFFVGFMANVFFSGEKSASFSLWVSATLWLIIFIKLLLTPEILYGFRMLSKKIEDYSSLKPVMGDVWSFNATQEILNPKDQNLTGKVNPLIKQHFHKIEEIALFNNFFRNADVSINDLANELKVPISHITYIFKYHSNESFSNFKKIIRIQDAVNLLRNNYLSSQTLDSLSYEVGFTSYTSFFLSFKDIIGMSPQEYSLTI